MFQTSPQNDTIMQPKSHLNALQNTSGQGVPDSSILPTGLYKSPDSMHSDLQHADMFSVNSSGTTTPASIRSSTSYESNVSSASALSSPKRSSMKSSLKSTPSTEINLVRRSSPPTVRFADSEPTSRPKATPVQQQRQNYPQRNGIPNPLLRYQQRPASSFSSSASSRYSAGPQAYSTLPPRGLPTPQSGQIQYGKTRVGQRFSAPVQPSRPDPRWSGIPLPANFTPPSLALEHRVSSFQSVSSNLSVQSAPGVLQNPPTASPQGQYNPLEHYIPCLHSTCKTHYSRTQAGPTYHLPQGPYSLSKHHGYCPHHASKELKETEALCKRRWESLRQNAGRKTLGQIASEFDLFLETFRQERRLEDADLQRRQKRIVLGTPGTPDKGKQLENEDSGWIWKYTPRLCTRASCPSKPYSPFANHLYTFYHTPLSSTFAPLRTLCPSCAKNEVERFEHFVMQKWGSRCGWDEGEWNEWFDKAVKDRDMEREFWEKAQERNVGETRARKWSDRKEVKESGDGEVVEKEGAKEKKKSSVFKRLFG